MNTQDKKDIALAALYFTLATVITWWFIDCGWVLYNYDMSKMILSMSIAGGKWGLQIIAAIVFLKEERWSFIKKIGLTSFVGSIILMPYCFEFMRAVMWANSFFVSLVVSVLTMLWLYFYFVRTSGLSLKWYFFWVLCLAVAITLQLTVVFKVI